MKSKRMLMGAAVIGCVAATMMSGAYAQEAQHPGPVQRACRRPTALDQCSTAHIDAPRAKRQYERAVQRALQWQAEHLRTARWRGAALPMRLACYA